MKILSIAPSLVGRHDWPGRSARALAHALAEAGHTVTLAHTGDEEARGSEVGVDLRQFARARPQAWARSPGLHRFVRSTESTADAIHHFGVGLRTLHYAAEKAARERVPLVVSPRGLFGDWQDSGWERILAERLIHPGALAAVSGWHALSTGEADDLKARGIECPILVAPDGVHLPSEAERQTARERWHQLCPRAAERPTALFHGRLHSRKRILELIDLWLDTAPPEWLLLIVGTNDEYSRADLRDYLLRVLGSDRVSVESGEGQPSPHAVADLFLMPATRETLGRSTAAALATGVPALVTEGSPWAGFEREGAGWRVAWDDFPAALRVALNEAPAKRAERGANGRAWIAKHHSWSGVAGTLANFYAQLRGGGRTGA